MQTTADASAIREAMGRFLDRILDEPSLARYWAGIDRRRVRRHARLFVLEAIGGPELVDADIGGAHQPLAIDDDDFDRIAGILVDCLREASVSADVLALAQQRLAQQRGVIVTI